MSDSALFPFPALAFLEQLGLEGKKKWGGYAPLPSRSLASSPLPVFSPSFQNHLNSALDNPLAFSILFWNIVIFSSYLAVLLKSPFSSSPLPLQPLGDQAQKALKDLDPSATSPSLAQKQIARALHGPGQATVNCRRER